MRYLNKSILLFGLVFSAQAMAVTYHVQKFGDDLNTCGQTDPCLTIQHAIDQTAVGDRVLVGPGTYQENLSITQNDIRIVSLSGADATIIESVNDTVSTVEVNADDVVLGRQDKGFTIVQSEINITFGSNVLTFGNRLTFVGNIIRLSGTGPSALGIAAALFGDNHNIRLNEFLLTREEEIGLSVFPSGISPFVGIIADASGSNVVNNQFECSGGQALRLANGENSGTRVVGNTFTKCGNTTGGGEVFTPFRPAMFVVNFPNVIGSGIPSTNSGDTYRENIFINTNAAIGVALGSPNIIDNLVRNDVVGGKGILVADTTGARIKGNLLINNDIAIDISFDTLVVPTPIPVDTDVVKNTILSANTGISIANAGASHDDAIDRFALNNIINTACPLVLGQVLVTTLSLNNNYWGNTTGPDFSCDSNAQTSFAGGTLTTNPALIANPIEYQPSQ